MAGWIHQAIHKCLSLALYIGTIGDRITPHPFIIGLVGAVEAVALLRACVVRFWWHLMLGGYVRQKTRTRTALLHLELLQTNALSSSQLHMHFRCSEIVIHYHCSRGSSDRISAKTSHLHSTPRKRCVAVA